MIGRWRRGLSDEKVIPLAKETDFEVQVMAQAYIDMAMAAWKERHKQMNKEEAIEAIKRIKTKSMGTKEEFEELITAVRLLSTLYPRFELVVEEAEGLKQIDIMDVVMAELEGEEEISESMKNRIHEIVTRSSRVGWMPFIAHHYADDMWVINGEARLETIDGKLTAFVCDNPIGKPFTEVTDELRPYCYFIPN